MMLNKTFYLLLLSLIPLLGFSQANSQYPDSGNKIRLGFQTTGDGLIWRDTQPKVAGYQPINNKAAWIVLDTVNNKFYHYKNSAWTLAGGSDTTSIAYVNTYGTQTVNGAKTFTSAVTGARFNPTANTVTGTGMYLPEANTLGFSTNGTNKMSINQNGAIGIGMIPNSNWDASFKFFEFLGNTSIAPNSGLPLMVFAANYVGTSTGSKYIENNRSSRIILNAWDGLDYDFNVQTAVLGTAGNAISYTDKIRLYKSGFLSIGVDLVPTEKLDVDGNARIRGNIGAGIDVAQARLHVKGSGVDGNTSALKIDNSGGTNLLNILDNGAATFSSSIAATSATFSGNMVLGTTALSGGGAAQWLTANGTPYGGGLISSVSGVIKAYYYYDNSGYALVQGASGVGVKLVVNSSTNALTIASTGAATFSSSVTANSLSLTTPLSVANGGTNASTFTEGSVVFAGASGTYTQDNSNLFFDNTNKRLGIGTNTGTNTLTIKAPSASFRVESTTGTNFTDFRMVNTGGTLYNGISRSTGGVLGFEGNYEALIFYANTNQNNLLIGTGGHIRFLTSNDNGVSYPERMRITSGGNVGIGTTNPDPLSLSRERNLAIVTTATNAALTLVGGVAGRIDFGVGATRTAGIYSDVSNYTEIFTSTALPLVFSTNSAERMRITSGGNVGIGTTTPNYKLHVEGSGTANEIVGWFNNQGAFSSSIAVRNSSKTAYLTNHQGLSTPTYTGQLASALALGVASGVSPIQFWNGSPHSAKMTILENGNVGIGTASPPTNLTIEGTNRALPLQYNTGYGNIHIQTNETSTATNFGGSLTFGGLGRTAGPTEKFIWAAIAGRKDGSVEGDTKGYLHFGTLNDDTNQIQERMRITSAGNVGIGTVSPVNNLDLQAAISGAYTTSSSQAPLRVFNVTNAGGINSSFISLQCSTDNSSSNPIARIGVVGESASSNNGAMVMMTRDGGGVTERMRITSGGNVGIGTTSPITISGTPTLTIGSGGAQTPSITLFSQTGQGQISFAKGLTSSDPYDGYILYNSTSRLMAFGTAATERMRITSDGNVAIGATAITDPYTASGGGWQTVQFGKGGILGAYRTANESMTGFNTYTSAPDGFPKAIIPNVGGTAIRYYEDRITFNTLSTSGTAQTQTERMRITSDGEVYWNVIGTTGANLNTGGVLFRNNSGKYIQISTGLTTNAGLMVFYKSDGSGDVTNTGSISTSGNSTLYNTTSDYRLKEDFKDFNGLDLIGSIKIYDYQWKSDKSRMYGVVAHELQEIIPYAVQGGKDGKEMQGVDYSKLVPILIKSIQELSAEIDILKQEIINLKNK